MAQKQLITYRLNPDGTVPDFLCHHGIGGVFPVYDPNTPPPQDNIIFGMSEYPVDLDTPGIVDIFETKEEVSDYLTTILADGVVLDPENPGQTKPIDVDATIEWVWGIYTAENGI